MKGHQFKVNVTWTGNKGEGTKDYKSYSRDHVITIEGKQVIQGSSDPVYRGDGSKHNPEDMFLSAVSTCHMLWYLHICADHGIVVTSYRDDAVCMLDDNHPEGGRFTEITLHPHVVITDEKMINKANELHELANSKCFIANTLNIPVRHQPSCEAAG